MAAGWVRRALANIGFCKALSDLALKMTPLSSLRGKPQAMDCTLFPPVSIIAFSVG